MLNPSDGHASTESSSPHVGLRNPPVKLSVIAGNYSNYSGSTIGHIHSTQDASKPWPMQLCGGLGVAAAGREHEGNL